MSAIFMLSFLWWGFCGFLMIGFILLICGVEVSSWVRSWFAIKDQHDFRLLEGRDEWLRAHFGEEGRKKWIENYNRLRLWDRRTPITDHKFKADGTCEGTFTGVRTPIFYDGSGATPGTWGTPWLNKIGNTEGCWYPYLDDYFAAGMWRMCKESSGRVVLIPEDVYRPGVNYHYRKYDDGDDLWKGEKSDPNYPFPGAGVIRVQEARKLRELERDEVNNPTTGFGEGYVTQHYNKYQHGKRFKLGWYREDGFLYSHDKSITHDARENYWYDKFPYGIPDIYGVVDGKGKWVQLPLTEWEQKVNSYPHTSKHQITRIMKNYLEHECRWVRVEDVDRLYAEREAGENQWSQCWGADSYEWM